MTDRNQWAKRFAAALADFKNIKDFSVLRDDVKEWLLESLEPAQLDAYEWVGVTIVTTNDVIERFGLRPNHASTLLKSLYDLGLLDRRKVVDENGRHFEYWRKS